MKVLIISGGKKPSETLLLEKIKECDYIIGADSGANCAYEYNIELDLLVGDLDSISKEALVHFKNSDTKIKEFSPEKDFTDTEIAMEVAFEKEVEEIIFLGCTGDRVDHVYANIGLLKLCLDKKIHAELIDDNNRIFLKDSNFKLTGEKGNTFSLYAHSEDVLGVTIKGAKYPLDKYHLKVGESIGTSNEFMGKEVMISIEKGRLLVAMCSDSKE